MFGSSTFSQVPIAALPTTQTGNWVAVDDSQTIIVPVNTYYDAYSYGSAYFYFYNGAPTFTVFAGQRITYGDITLADGAYLTSDLIYDDYEGYYYVYTSTILPVDYYDITFYNVYSSLWTPVVT